MRPSRVFPAILACTLSLGLVSCRGAGSDDALRDIRAELNAASGIRFAADIRADYGERVFDFSVEYESAGDGGTLTVTAPEIIAGAQIRYSGGATALAVGDAEFYTGEILPGGLSPADAVPVMTQAWKTGFVTETVREKYGDEICISALFRIDDSTDLRTWFSEETGLPAGAEFIFDGYTVITVDFHDMEAA